MSRCTCTVNQIRNYNARISKPLLDRIDINVEVRRIRYGELFEEKHGATSAEMRDRVLAAHRMQLARYKEENIRFNSQLDSRLCEKYIQLGCEELEFMKYCFENLGLTARGGCRILKIARTIADLDGDADVCVSHMKEAVFFRNTDE